ncbi:hypothetical protein LINPERPRIM_LOCUS24743 [Linum perenne]
MLCWVGQFGSGAHQSSS